jgi:hypothetical protein
MPCVCDIEAVPIMIPNSLDSCTVVRTSYPVGRDKLCVVWSDGHLIDWLLWLKM